MKNSLLVLLICVSSFGYTQVGFYSKKNIVEFSGSFNIPVLSGFYKVPNYKTDGESLKEVRDFYDYGYNVSIERVLTNHFAIGACFLMKDYGISLPTKYEMIYNIGEGFNAVDSFAVRFENLQFTNNYFGPKLEFSAKKGTVGVGLSYDLAFGMSISKFKNRSYAYSVNEIYPTTEENWTKVDYYTTDNEWRSFYGAFIQTGFKLSYPLSKSLTLNSGFHYTINYTIKSKEMSLVDNADKELFNYEDVYYQVQRENLGMIQFNLGMSFLF